MNLEEKHLDIFFDIYENSEVVRDIPKNTLVTVYFKGSDDEGFLDNVYRDELGLELLIAKKWQFQDVIDKLLSDS